MLVATMTIAEVNAAVLKDYEKLSATSFMRLLDEYNRERKKLKIAKEAIYPRMYRIKSGAKNVWHFFVRKSPVKANYHEGDAVSCGVTSYFSPLGLQFFRPQAHNQFMEVFYGHFFTRYNERMNLNLANHTDIVFRFMSNCGYLQPAKWTENGKVMTSAICNDGIALGNYYDDVDWLVHKTFISHDMKNGKQQVTEQRVLLQLQIDLINKSLTIENPKEGKLWNDDAGAIQLLGRNHSVVQLALQ